MIELLIVVGIIGILAIVAIPIFDHFSDRSKIDELKSRMLVAGTVQEKYFSSKGVYSSDTSELASFGFPADTEQMKIRTGVVLKNGVGMSYWVTGLRKIRGEVHCWMYVSSLMGTTEQDNFRELKSNERPYTGIDCNW